MTGLTHSESEILESVAVLEAVIAAPAPPAVAKPVRVVLDTLRDLSAEVLRLSQARGGLDRVLAGKIIDKLLDRRL